MRFTDVIDFDKTSPSASSRNMRILYFMATSTLYQRYVGSRHGISPFNFASLV